uniref:Secreted protein n=1 Tax=Peronospora matthiolae TaxID=2874970 RepID=A0AAV1TPA9_9STRA
MLRTVIAFASASAAKTLNGTCGSTARGELPTRVTTTRRQNECGAKPPRDRAECKATDARVGVGQKDVAEATSSRCWIDDRFSEVSSGTRCCSEPVSSSPRWTIDDRKDQVVSYVTDQLLSFGKASCHSDDSTMQQHVSPPQQEDSRYFVWCPP